MAIIDGTAQGVGDTLRGTRDDDVMNGFSGDDVMRGGRGEDRMIGGQGNDVMFGGMDADTFVWSAGHIGEGEVDYVADFDLRQGDMLQFLDSASADIQILSVEKVKTDVTEANGVDLRNNVDRGTDVVFTIQNSSTGEQQEIVLLDSWSNGLNGLWETFLEDLGVNFSDYVAPEPEPVEVVTIDEELIFIEDDIFNVG